MINKTQKIIFTVLLAVSICLSVVAFFLQFTLREYTAAEIYDRCIKSVTEIKAVTENVAESYGTGEIIDADGLVITNAHVVTFKRVNEVTEFENYYIRFAFEDEYRKAELVKYDCESDLAILKIVEVDGVNVEPISFGDSGSLRSGEKVYAVGNASNYGIGIFQGIVSIPSVNVEADGVNRKVIQCDVSIAAGNSGGALINKEGNLIGITTFRIKDNGGNVVYGIVYAIPIATVLEYLI